MTTLSVLMPVYNESRTLRTIVAKVLDSPVEMDIELICVDDCSSDDSLEILREAASADSRIRVIAQPINMGKGKAIRTAIENMTGDIAIIQDADLEYDPADYRKVIQPLVDGRADAVYGSRFAASDQRRVLFFWHALGNKLLTLLCNMANDLNLTDMETCYKAVRADLLRRLRLTSDRFGLEPEITARLAQWGARIYEVPISYHGRTYAEGKNIGWRDGVEALWFIFKFRFLDTRATDEDSVVTRQSLGRAPRFRRWLLSQFGDHLGSAILEVNAGPGHTTSHLLRTSRLVVTDSDPVHVETLLRRFGHLENVEVRAFDPLGAGPVPSDLDTVLLLDGLQRSDEPKDLLASVAQCLAPGGKVLIQVPAHQWLFSDTDVALEHRKRFTVDSVRHLLDAMGFEVLSCKEFNRLGVLGWMVNKFTRRTTIGRWQARLFGLLLPLARFLETFEFLPGLSIVAVARPR